MDGYLLTQVRNEALAVETASASRLVRVRELWDSLRKNKLEIGRLLYEERAERLSVGGRGIEEGFHAWLRDAGIPKTSAYRRIAEYEISIGERSENDEFDKPVPNGTTFQNADVVQGEQVTTNDEMPYRIEPSAPNFSEIAHGAFWEDLYRQLTPLTQTISDGAEHALVVLLNEARTRDAASPAEQNFRSYVVSLLKQISKEFSERASELEALCK